jgi:hypothetical protein
VFLVSAPSHDGQIWIGYSTCTFLLRTHTFSTAIYTPLFPTFSPIMSIGPGVYYAAGDFLTQADPMTVLVIFDDFSIPAHSFLSYDLASQMTSFHAMNESYTNLVPRDVDFFHWGSHSRPSRFEILHPNAAILGLLAGQEVSPSSHIARTKDACLRGKMKRAFATFANEAQGKVNALAPRALLGRVIRPCGKAIRSASSVTHNANTNSPIRSKLRRGRPTKAAGPGRTGTF